MSWTRTLLSWSSDSELEFANLATELVGMLKLPVAPATVRAAIVSHFSYPSVLAIVDGLDSLGIESEALKLSPAAFASCSAPFLAQTQTGDFVLVETSDETGIRQWSQDTGYSHIASTDIEDTFSGIILRITSTENAYDRNFLAQRKLASRTLRTRIAQGLGAALSLFLLSWASYQFHGLAFTALLSTKLLGAFFALQLLLMEVSQGRFRSAFCGLSQKGGCTQVLQSKGSHIWGIPVAAIGSLYFFAGSLSLLFSATSPIGQQVTQVWTYFSVLALPYVVFSLSYQAFKIRVFCPLCVAVQCVLIAEAALLGPTILQTVDLTLPLVGHMLAALLLPWLAWSQYKNLYAKSGVAPELERTLAGITSRAPVIQALLDEGEANVMFPPSPLFVALGPSNAPHCIQIISSLSCAACAVLHDEVERSPRDDIRFELHFTTPDAYYQISSQYDIFAAARSSGRLLEVIRAWYEITDDATAANWEAMYKTYASDEPLEDDALDGKELEQALKDWQHEVSVPYTPFRALNNREIPQALNLRTVLKHLQSR